MQQKVTKGGKPAIRFSVWQRFGIWFGYTVCMPMIFIGMAWFIGIFTLKTDHAAAETFGTGDLLPLAALILLGVAAEIRASDASSGWLFFHEIFFVASGLALAIAYGSLKTIGIETLKLGTAESYRSLIEFARLSFAILIYAIAHATLAKIVLERKIAGSLWAT